MQPYVVRQGEFLAILAYKLGFDADAVWNDPSNSDLRALRPNPNILAPGDMIQLPGPTQAAPTSLATGSTNAFVSSAPAVTITQKLVGPDASTYASRAFSVAELPTLTGLQTDSSGNLTFDAPVTLATATVVFPDSGESWTLNLGAMDPIDSLVGIYKRLQNLGYIGTNLAFDPVATGNNLPVMRAALVAFNADQGAAPPPSAPGSGPSSVAPASTAPASAPPPSGGPTATGAAPADGPTSDAVPTDGPTSTGAAPAAGADTGPASAPASGPPPDSAPASNPAPDSAPPSSAGPASSPDSSPSSDSLPPTDYWDGDDASRDATADTSGLSDDGTLDDATTSLLQQAHGC
jgi:hypothetical protein